MVIAHIVSQPVVERQRSIASNGKNRMVTPLAVWEMGGPIEIGGCSIRPKKLQVVKPSDNEEHEDPVSMDISQLIGYPDNEQPVIGLKKSLLAQIS
jgi:hypothetical protein